MSASPSFSAKNVASSTMSRRGAVTKTNAVDSSAQQVEHLGGTIPESLLHAVERLEERRCIAYDVAADDLRHRAQERLRRDVDGLDDPAGRRHQDAVEAVVEEAREAAGRLEEVERVAGRRRVDDDQVEAALLVQLVELLHRHVLLRARERAGDVAVEAVRQDAPRLLLGLGVLRDQIVERALGVEHQRPQLAGPRSPSTFDAVLVRPSRPSALASRLAGSIVTTHARCPDRALRARAPRPSWSCRRRPTRCTRRCRCSSSSARRSVAAGRWVAFIPRPAPRYRRGDRSRRARRRVAGRGRPRTRTAARSGAAAAARRGAPPARAAARCACRRKSAAARSASASPGCRNAPASLAASSGSRSSPASDR